MTKVKDTKTYILESARRVISKNGIQGATMRAIAEESSLSTGAIYHYFNSKEEILYAIMDNSLSVSSKIALESRSEVIERSTLVEEINDNILKRFKKIQENRVQFYLSQEAIMGDAELIEKFKKKYAEWIGKSDELIKFLYNKPETKYDQAVASLLIGAIDGVVMQLLLKSNTATKEDICKVYELLLKEGLPCFLDMVQKMAENEMHPE
jgi:AcrR family transcriptional regulator